MISFMAPQPEATQTAPPYRHPGTPCFTTKGAAKPLASARGELRPCEAGPEFTPSKSEGLSAETGFQTGVRFPP